MGSRSNGSFTDRTYTQPQHRMFDNNMGVQQPAMTSIPSFGGGFQAVSRPAPYMMNTSPNMVASGGPPPGFYDGAPKVTNLADSLASRDYMGGGGLLGMPQQPQIPGMTPNPKMPGMCG
jgi:hypothetical protein